MKSIYQIRNKVNNKIYIGSSVSIDRRWNTHKYELRHDKHCNQYLQNSWNKYGEQNFIFEILLICEEFELLRYEQWYLDNQKPVYNVLRKAGNLLGFKHTEETKRIISEGQSGEKNCNYGKNLSEEHKRKISKNHARLSGEDHPMFGRKQTEEARQKMRENHTRPSGEHNPASKLKRKEVQKIRELYKTGDYSYRKLGVIFKVSYTTIGRIIKEEIWEV